MGLNKKPWSYFQRENSVGSSIAGFASSFVLQNYTNELAIGGYTDFDAEIISRVFIKAH